MAKARFTEDHNFTPSAMNGQLSKLYRANTDYTDCTRECIEQAEAKGILANGKGSEKVQSQDEENTKSGATGGAGQDRPKRK